MLIPSIAINRAQFERLSTDKNGAVFLSIADAQIKDTFAQIQKLKQILLHTREQRPRRLKAKVTWAEIAESPFDETSKKRFIFLMLKEVENG